MKQIPVINRTCGECTACCVAPSLAELDKPEGAPCPELRPENKGRSCNIYGERPSACSGFRCGWLQGQGSDEHRPDRLGAMFVFQDTEAGPVFVLYELRPGRAAQPWVIGETMRLAQHHVVLQALGHVGGEPLRSIIAGPPAQRAQIPLLGEGA